MTGLYLLLVLGLWTVLCWQLASRLGRTLPHRYARAAVTGAAMICLLPLPLADEIYSLPAVQRICSANADLVVFDRQMSGKTVWFMGTKRTSRKVGMLRGVEARSDFVIAVTEEPAFQYTSLTVEGGWLMRTLGLTQTPAPLLFEGHCQPKNLEQQRRQLNINVTDKPK
jgi:hypothetical protein